MSSLFTDLKDETMLQEILKECELAEEYLQAMKTTMLNDKGDCDNVRMHIAKIKGKVNTLLIPDVVGRSEQLSQCKCGNTVQVECDDCKDDRIRSEYM